MTDQTFFNLLAEDKELITYRKSLNKITGGVTSTILLQQIIYWAKKKQGQPFFKFRAPCNHPLYSSGDSWTEELGFSACEFDTALSHIGTKITRGISKADVMKNEEAKSLVVYWTDANRVTWYLLNTDLLGKLGKSIYLVKQESEFTKEIENTDLPLTETPSETTRENGKSEDLPTQPIGKQLPVKTDKPTDKQPQPKKELFAYFTDYTKLTPPANSQDQGYWYKNIGEILAISNQDLPTARRLIKQSVDKLRADDLTISTPGSLVKTIRALAANGNMGKVRMTSV